MGRAGRTRLLLAIVVLWFPVTGLAAACANVDGLTGGGTDATIEVEVDVGNGLDVAGQDGPVDAAREASLDGDAGDGCTLPDNACAVFCGTFYACGQAINCPPCDAACEGSTIYACNGRACGAFPDNCGAQTDCGTCSGTNSLCVDDGSCCADPNACVNQGAQCGFVSNGCDGVPCGTCDASYQCSGTSCVLSTPDGSCGGSGASCSSQQDCCATLSCFSAAAPLRLPGTGTCEPGPCRGMGSLCTGGNQCCVPLSCEAGTAEAGTCH